MTPLSWPRWSVTPHTLRKALDQWLEGDDDRKSRVVIVVGDPEAVTRTVSLVHDAHQGWALDTSVVWPAHAKRLHGPITTAIAAWLAPADVLAIAAPEDTDRLQAILESDSELRAIWAWSEPAIAAAQATPTELEALQAVLEAPEAHGISPELAEQVRKAQGISPMTPSDASVIGWCLRHAALLTTDLAHHPRVRVVSPYDLGDPTVRSELLAWLGLHDSEARPPPASSTPEQALMLVGSVQQLVDDVRGQLLKAATGQT